jgi:hypothetical protein
MRLLILTVFVFALSALAVNPAFAEVDCSNYSRNAAIQTVAPTPEPNPAALIAIIDAALYPQADTASIDSAAVNEAAVDGIASIFSSASNNTLPVCKCYYSEFAIIKTTARPTTNQHSYSFHHSCLLE